MNTVHSEAMEVPFAVDHVVVPEVFRALTDKPKKAKTIVDETGLGKTSVFKALSQLVKRSRARHSKGAYVRS